MHNGKKCVAKQEKAMHDDTFNTFTICICIGKWLY